MGKSRSLWSLVVLVSAGLITSFQGDAAPPIAPRAAAPAPLDFVSQDVTRNAFSLPRIGLTDSELVGFSKGRHQFEEKWAVAPEPVSAWGLGPTFNEDRCSRCHDANGRASTPSSNREIADGVVVRLSVPGAGNNGAPAPHENYGTQLQNRGIAGYRGGEGRAVLRWVTHEVVYADGYAVELRAPRLHFVGLQYGPLGEDAMISVRIAPQLVGLGLLEAVPESALANIAKQQLELGVSGRLNRVWDVERRRLTVGRFGWKAGQPTLRQQIAAAFLHDIGATSELFPNENCPPGQISCATLPSASQCAHQHDCTGFNGFWVHPYRPEAERSRIANMVSYLANLAVPARRALDEHDVQIGALHFQAVGCASCHWSELPLRANVVPSREHQVIRPYTDLLLHDMGPGLADGRPEFAASGAEWRTPPLWGLGLVTKVNGSMALLHDGRARTIEEAILWHGGEAAAARSRFMAMPSVARRALMRFVQSL